MERRRLGALLALCETPRCLRQTLLATFGEAAQPCGFCDICDGGHRMFDGVVAAQKAMSAILRTSGRFFPGHLANLLIGKATEAIHRHRHDDLPTFGVGGEFTAAEWRSIFRQIQAAGLIAQDEADAGRWQVTEEGRAVLAGKTPLALVAAEDGSRKARGARRILRDVAEADAPRSAASIDVDRDDDAALTTDDQRLFASLKQRRLELARARKVPPYVIFNDRTLREIAHARPRDAAALARIHGVGPAKIEDFGAMVMEVVAQHAAA